jgi:hypothetical protein
MSWRAAAFPVALASVIAPARATDVSPAHWKYDNPFCQVVASVVPIPDVVASVNSVSGGVRYELALFTAAGELLAAHVTLVSGTDAYDAAVPDGSLSGPMEDRTLGPIVVTLPSPDRVAYFLVE